MNINKRLTALRAAMRKNGIDAYLVPSDDDHASEYVNDHFKCREWITGFTGSPVRKARRFFEKSFVTISAA